MQAEIISIHAPREGGDLGILRRAERRGKISIHAPREGGDRTVGLTSASG